MSTALGAVLGRGWPRRLAADVSRMTLLRMIRALPDPASGMTVELRSVR